VVVDLGCGNGWALRVMARRFPGLRGVGLDGFGENIRQATARAEAAGLGDRLRFVEGELSTFRPDEPIDALFMSRALHHVWPDAHAVLSQLRDALRPGGHVILWEPAWPDDLSALRDPRRRVLAFQNVSEHIQGNHFLRPADIVAAVEAVGLQGRGPPLR
jgi:trans-aconitate methyltransferase